MAIKTTAQLIAEIAALFPDNNTELITPAAVRLSLGNIVDSMTPSFGALRGVTPVVAALTTVPVQLNIFDTVIVSTPGQLVASAVADNIITVVGNIVQFSFTISMAGANNSDVQVELRRNGVATGWLALQTTLGAANRVVMTLAGYTVAGSGDIYTLWGSVLAGADNVTMSASAFIMQRVQQ